MKTLLLNIILFLFFLFPNCLFAQTGNATDQDITGLWKGSLYNDSTRKFLPYEIAISEEKGKLVGYSYTMFEDSGKKEVGVKRIKIKKKDGEVIVEDVEMISNNFSVVPPKKVKVQSILALYTSDTSMEMRGRWSTNRTWEYSQLTGSLQVKRSNDFKQMALFEKLQELKLEKELSFVKDAENAQKDIAKAEKPILKNKTVAGEPNQSIVDNSIAVKDPIIDNRQAGAIEKNAAATAKEAIGVSIAKAPENKPKESEEKKAVELAAKSGPVKPGIQQTQQPIAKVTETPKAPPIVSSDLIKKNTDPFVKDSILKKLQPFDQSIAKKTIAEKPAAITMQLPPKKTTGLLAKDTLAKKIKPAEDLVVKPATKPIVPGNLPTDKKKEIVTVPTVKKEKGVQVSEQPITIAPAPAAKNTAPAVAANKPMQKDNKIAKAITVKPATNEKPVAPITAPAIIVSEPLKPITTATIVSPPKQKTEVPVIIAAPVVKAAANVAERKMKNEQSVYFESDSLVLTLYDNGEVDGDTVSVLMNGQIIFAKQGLTTKANSKTVYIDKSTTDTLSMVMYAESLGSIPPNTGLLIIMDGEKRYEVRFSADLQTNAAILLRRKPTEQ